MSTKFFQSVRRNQKQWMVVVTVLSMVSFLFLDDFGRGKGPMSALGGALMIGSLCAAGMCIVGYPRGKTMEFGVGGFLVGFLAGFVGFGAVSANRPIVRTSLGSMTRTDLDRLARDRQKLNAFWNAAARKADIPQQMMPYLDLNDAPIVQQKLLAAEAKKMGIQITDERVLDFIKQVTRNRLYQKDVPEVLREAKLGEGELFELLRSQLAAELVVNLTEPPGYMPPIPNELAMNFARMKRQIWYMQQTPDQLWNTFEKLHLKESLLAAAIPVKDFVSKVADPTEAELVAFFDKFKYTTWVDEARPGFTQLPRVQLAYLTGDFQNFEQGQEPTEAEVQSYYDRNKTMFPVHRSKESTAPEFPDEPADAMKPESPVDDAAKSADEKKTTGDEPKGDSTPDGEAKKKDGDRPNDESANKKRESEKSKEPKPADDPKSNCGEEGTAEKPAADDSKETKPAKDKDNEEATASDSKSATEDKPASNKSDGDKSEAPAKSDADNELPESSIPKLSKTPTDFPPPEFRQLDDELKLEIREKIVNERAFQRLATELDKAREFMVDLSLEYDSVTDPKKKVDVAKSIASRLQDYAVTHKLEYKQLSELTYEELSSQQIGRASDTRDRAPVADVVFTSAANGPRVPLYSPRRADLKVVREAFAYWKTSELPARVSDLKDEKSRQLAIAAWKFDKARPLAEERAKELAKKAQSEKNDLAAALSGESITGNKSDPQISLIPTIDFSWKTMNRSFPGAGGGPKTSTIPLIDNIGEDFMKTVFEQLANGETGVATDEPRAVFYVVKVVDRDEPKQDDGGESKRELHERFMKEDFASQFFPYMPSAYQSMAHNPQELIDMAWEQRARQNFRMDWEANAPIRSGQ